MKKSHEELMPKTRLTYNKFLVVDNQIKLLRESVALEKNYEQKNVLRHQLLKKQAEKKKTIQKMRTLVGIFKTDLNFAQQSSESSQKNFTKLENIYQRKYAKYLKNSEEFNLALIRRKDYHKDLQNRKTDFIIVHQSKKITKKINSLITKINNLERKSTQITEKLKSFQQEKEIYQVETIEHFETDFAKFIQEAKENQNVEELVKLEKDYQFLKQKTASQLVKLEKRILKNQSEKEILNLKIEKLKTKISENEAILEQSKKENRTTFQRAEQQKKDQKLIQETNLLKSDVSSSKKIWQRSQKNLEKRKKYQTKLENNLQFLATTIGVDLELISPKVSKVTNAFDQLEKLLLKDWFFIVMVGILGTGVVLSTYMYIEYGVGALNEVFVIEALDQGLKSGDYSAALGFAVGFLIARILEGPLVGILDVGGSILTGLGVGIPAVFLSSTKLAFMMHNPFYACLIGLFGGALIGAIIILIRIFKPKEAINLGTDIMIGAGNATGKFLGPLVVFSAAMFQPLVGIGAGIGAILFVWLKKPIVGGAIIGSMIFGLVPAFI